MEVLNHIFCGEENLMKPYKHRVSACRRRFQRTRQSRMLESLESRCVLNGSSALKDVIVMFNDGANAPAETVRDLISTHGGQSRNIYQHAFKGFSASLPPAAIQALEHNPNVRLIEPIMEFATSAQTLPSGIDRVDAEINPFSSINNTPEDIAWNFHVGVLDTGIDSDHPDLNVDVNLSKNFVRSTSGDSAYDDKNGHGTHTSGSIGAIDNDQGVVGVAPGIPIVGLKVLGNSGSGSNEDIANGIDYIVSTRTNADPSDDIAVVNMSWGSIFTSAVIQTAIETMTSYGVIGVASAGNSGGGAGFPARMPETIAVAALADSDGQPGGLGADTSSGPDDTLAEFSSRGSYVDIAAPGVDILSTYKGGGYSVLSGTSMAAPHVTGIAALFIAEFSASAQASGAWPLGLPRDAADVELVRQSIQATALLNQGTVAQPNSSYVFPIADASGNWVTVPVVDIVEIGGQAVDSTTVAYATGIMKLKIDARDVDTSANDLTIELQLNGVPVSTSDYSSLYDANAQAYIVTWNTTSIPDGNYQLSVTAVDGQGNVSNPSARLLTTNSSVVVDNINDPPTVQIRDPLSNTQISGVVTLTAEIQDDGGMAQGGADFTIVGTSTNITLPPPLTIPAVRSQGDLWTAVWDTRTVPDELYSITITAHDGVNPPVQDVVTHVEVANSTTAGSLYVSDLVGSTKNGPRKSWVAIVYVYIRDLNGEAVSGATISSVFTVPSGQQYPLTATSNADSYVWFELHGLRDEHDPVVFAVTDIVHPALNYQPSLNTDLDHDSDGTTMTLSRSGVIVPAMVGASVLNDSNRSNPRRGGNATDVQAANESPNFAVPKSVAVLSVDIAADKPQQSPFAGIAIDSILANDEDDWVPVDEGLANALVG